MLMSLCGQFQKVMLDVIVTCANITNVTVKILKVDERRMLRWENITYQEEGFDIRMRYLYLEEVVLI